MPQFSFQGARSAMLSRTWRVSPLTRHHERPTCRTRLRAQARIQRRPFTVSACYHEQEQRKTTDDTSSTSSVSSSTTESDRAGNEEYEKDSAYFSMPAGWEDNTDYGITAFSQLPHRHFGYNQHIKINEDFKESLRQILWQFRAPIRYAFAYGSGVFGQTVSSPGGSLSAESLSPHPNPPKAVEEWQKGGAKIIDFVFGVSHTQHWHSLNLTQHPEHYSGLRWLPYSSAAISFIQDKMGAGVYFNPFINVNGVMIKYGVVNLNTLARDLSEWDTLYLAGRLQKPVKILRDDARIRLANQVNLISALRTALLMLPENFTERQLYERIAGLSYMGDPRMNKMIASENPNKVANIVGAQLPGFRQLYVPLIFDLPNLDFTDSRTPHAFGWEKLDAIRHTGTNPQLDDVLGGADGLTLQQDMDPVKRGNMVRRLPKAFRKKLYHQYKTQFGIPGSAFSDILDSSQDEDVAVGTMRKREGGDFERRIAQQDNLNEIMAKCVTSTVSWPATSQTAKSFFTAGVGKAWKYYSEKRKKGRQIASSSSPSKDAKEESTTQAEETDGKEKKN